MEPAHRQYTLEGIRNIMLISLLVNTRSTDNILDVCELLSVLSCFVLSCVEYWPALLRSQTVRVENWTLLRRCQHYRFRAGNTASIPLFCFPAFWAKYASFLWLKNKIHSKIDVFVVHFKQIWFLCYQMISHFFMRALTTNSTLKNNEKCKQIMKVVWRRVFLAFS